jgi:hypothetical protein
MTSHVIEKFTVERNDRKTRTVVCKKEDRIMTPDVSRRSNKSESLRSGLQHFEFDDNGQIAYEQKDGTFQDRYGNIYRRRII